MPNPGYWIQMNFLSKSLRITSRNLFSSPLHSKRLARRILFLNCIDASPSGSAHLSVLLEGFYAYLEGEKLALNVYLNIELEECQNVLLSKQIRTSNSYSRH